MTHPCSDGFDEEIEWLFQLKGNGGIEIMFQWFKVQCKMWGLHETCKNNDKTNESRTHGVYW
jgi:hypothetical protein